jgi:4-aminobutyrate aminotransferase/(S)-3-amino-2-methylpropionate transaminase
MAGLATAHPLFIDRAAGAMVVDVDGNELVDMTGGIGVMNVGHTQIDVVQAIARQAGRLTHGCFQVVGYEGYVAVAEALCRLAPGSDEKRALLVSTGAEAVENAVKIARAHTRRGAVLCFEHAFHGRTLLGMSLTGKAQPYRAGFGPYAPDVYRLPYPYPYRDEGPRGGLERALRTIVRPDDLAAVVIEPMLGEGGFITPPLGFWAELRGLCDRHGVVLVVDEVQTGFGRTGPMFACDRLGLVPDLMTVAKSIAGGLPLAAVVGRARIMDSVPPGGVGGTFGGNPVACAAALEVIGLLEQAVAAGRPEEIGQRIHDRMRVVATQIPLIGDVRGLGPMQAIELVLDRATKQPATEETARVIAAARARGVLLLSAGTFGNVVRFLVPLVISDALLDEALAVVEEALRLTARP